MLKKEDLWHGELNPNIAANRNGKLSTSKKAIRSAGLRERKRRDVPGRREQGERRRQEKAEAVAVRKGTKRAHAKAEGRGAGRRNASIRFSIRRDVAQKQITAGQSQNRYPWRTDQVGSISWSTGGSAPQLWEKAQRNKSESRRGERRLDGTQSPGAKQIEEPTRKLIGLIRSSEQV